MKTRIYIATTNGPVEIQRITREDAQVRSVICLNGTAKALPIARAYDAFVKEPTGVVQRSFDHPSYRLDVNQLISNGNSWQLGVFCAHAFHHENQLAGPDDTIETALWLTGEVDRDLNIRPVEHIQDKLQQSRDLFAQLRAQNIRTFCFIPGGAGLIPDDDFLESLNIDGDLLYLESVLDVRRICKRFDLKDPYPKEEDNEDEDLDEDDIIDLYKPDKNAPPAPKDSKPLRILILAGMVMALLAGLYLQFEDNIRALRANSLKIGLSELRASPSHGCLKPQKIPLKKADVAFPSSSLNGLCAIEITLTNLGAPAYLWVFAQRLKDGHMLLADRESLLEATLQKGQIGWQMVLPKNLKKSIDYRIVALASASPLADPINRMLRHIFEGGKPNWEDIKAQLISEKITVISLLHSLEK